MSAGVIEDQVVNELVRIFKSPEIIAHIDKLAISNKDINRDALLKAVQNLKEIWDYLYQAEQRKIAQILLNSVIFQDNGMELNLNLDGLNRLLIELAQGKK